MWSRAVPLLLSSLMVSIISINPLQAGAYDPIVPPDFHRQSLLNGMEIFFLPAQEPQVPFVLVIKNGAAFDPIGKWGATHLTAWMIREQTRTRTGLPVQANLQQLEAELDFRVDWDAIYFFGHAQTTQVGEVLNLLGEMIVRPEFEEETFERLRQEVVQQAKAEREHPRTLTKEIFQSELFQANPYAHSVKGTPETLTNLNLTDLKIQYRKLFVPNQARLALYHSGDRETLFTDLSRRWGGWIREQALPFTFRPATPPEGRRIILLEGSAEQSLFRWGTLSVPRGSREYYILKVFENYLTLHLPTWASKVASEQQIRGSSEVWTGIMPGSLQLSVQAAPQQLLRYLQQLQDFIQQLEAGELDEAKFEQAKQLAWRGLTDSLQRPRSRLERLLEMSLYNLGINYITHYGTRLSRISPGEFQETLRNLVSFEDFLLVVAGPVDELKRGLQEWGDVRTLE